MSQSDDESVSEEDDSDSSDESWIGEFEWESPPMLHRKAAALGEDQLALLRRANYDSSKRMKCALAALSRQAGSTPSPKSFGPAQKSFVETTLSELQVRHLPALDAFTPRGGVPTLASLANTALTKAIDAHYGRVGLDLMPSPEEQALPIPTPYDHNGQLCVVLPAQKRRR